MPPIDAKTKVCAVLGHPVGHSLSPELHNAAFAALGLPFVYVAHDIEPGKVSHALEGIRALGYRGLSVTIPHKIEAMHGVDQVDQTAREIGCINTVVNDDGHLLGYNSDGLGALSALRSTGANPKGRKVLVLGSGGAARAIVVTLARAAPPEQITILGVKMDELNTLVDDVRSQGQATIQGGRFTLESLQDEISGAEILLHCAPVGMHPNENNSLVPAEMLHADMTVFDVVYNPRRTKLLQHADAAGCRTIEGIEMFLGQAIVQFELWTGEKAPAEVMRQVVEAKL